MKTAKEMVIDLRDSTTTRALDSCVCTDGNFCRGCELATEIVTSLDKLIIDLAMVEDAEYYNEMSKLDMAAEYVGDCSPYSDVCWCLEKDNNDE